MEHQKSLLKIKKISKREDFLWRMIEMVVWGWEIHKFPPVISELSNEAETYTAMN